MTKQPASKAPDASLFAPFTLSSLPLTDMVGRAGEVCLDACRSWHEETARFIARRLERDAELVRHLLHCRDWTEALRLQQEWAAATAQDYFDQTRRLAEMVGKSVTNEEKSATAPARHTEAA